MTLAATSTVLSFPVDDDRLINSWANGLPSTKDKPKHIVQKQSANIVSWISDFFISFIFLAP